MIYKYIKGLDLYKVTMLGGHIWEFNIAIAYWMQQQNTVGN